MKVVAGFFEPKGAHGKPVLQNEYRREPRESTADPPHDRKKNSPV
jgi:hypothetical protein